MLFRSEEIVDGVLANAYSDKRYLSGEYEKAGIIQKFEEEIPSNLPEKIPVLGRAFKASDDAYKAGRIELQKEIYNLLADRIEDTGIRLSEVNSGKLGKNEQMLVNNIIEDLGKISGALTGRGNLKYNSKLTKIGLWAPRMLKANWDKMTGY